jgi:GNAT superfamily N-acetyltransferase
MITYRQVRPEFPTAVTPWYVEYFDDDPAQRLFPYATAYVSVTTAGSAHLDYVLVGDDWRKRGIARALIKACQERWPSLQFSSHMVTVSALLGQGDSFVDSTDC